MRTLNRWRFTDAAIVLFLVVASISSAGAASVESLEGELRFAQAHLRGNTESKSSRLEAGHATSELSNLFEGSWSLQASNVIINWTHQVRMGIGSKLDGSGQSFATAKIGNRSGETNYDDVTISSVISSANSDLLLVPALAPLQFEVLQATQIEVQPSGGEKWKAGYRPTGRVPIGGSDEAFLVKVHETTPGQPLFQSSSSLQWRVRGDFVLYVWGANVTVTHLEGFPVVYRSGAWKTNETSVLTREEHTQLLRITLTDASFTFNHVSGKAQWTAPETRTSTQGTVLFQEAEGELESPLHQYVLNKETLPILGETTQKFSGSFSRDGVLTSELEAQGAWIPLAPTSTVSKGPESSPSWFWLLFVLVPLAGAGLFRYARNRVLFGKRKDRIAASPNEELPDRLLAQAAAELLKENPAKARKVAQRALRIAPGYEEAWFLYGLSLLEEKNYKQLLLEFLPMTEKGDRFRRSLAFPLAIANAALGNADDTYRWLEVASEDPDALRLIERDPRVASYFTTSRFRRLLPTASAEAAYV